MVRALQTGWLHSVLVDVERGRWWCRVCKHRLCWSGFFLVAIDQAQGVFLCVHSVTHGAFIVVGVIVCVLTRECRFSHEIFTVLLAPSSHWRKKTQANQQHRNRHTLHLVVRFHPPLPPGYSNSHRPIHLRLSDL